MKLNLLASASTLAMGGLLSIVAPMAAQANYSCTIPGVCTATYSTGYLPTDLSSSANGNTYLQIPEFNTVNGTLALTGITITVTEAEYSTGSIINNGSSTLNVTANMSSQFSFGTSGVASLDGFLGGKLSGSLGSSYSYNGLAGNGASVAYVPTTGSLANPVTASKHFSPTDFADYSSAIAGSDLQALVSTLTTTLSGQVGSGGNANVTNTIATDAELTVAVTYDYKVAAPEPASLALIATGLTSLGVIRRRRKV